MGKGSKPRPLDKQKFNENFDRIFKKGEQCLAAEERKDTKEDRSQN